MGTEYDSHLVDGSLVSSSDQTSSKIDRETDSTGESAFDDIFVHQSSLMFKDFVLNMFKLINVNSFSKLFYFYVLSIEFMLYDSTITHI